MMNNILSCQKTKWKNEYGERDKQLVSEFWSKIRKQIKDDKSYTFFNINFPEFEVTENFDDYLEIREEGGIKNIYVKNDFNFFSKGELFSYDYFSFQCCTFLGDFEFGVVSEQIDSETADFEIEFHGIKINKGLDFISCIFYEQLHLFHVELMGDLDFQASDFKSSIDFYKFNFYGDKINFDYCNTNEIDLKGVTAKYLSFKGGVFENIILNYISPKGTLFINFINAQVNNILKINLASTKYYLKTTLGLYNSDIEYLSCDHSELKHINLFSYFISDLSFSNYDSVVETKNGIEYTAEDFGISKLSLTENDFKKHLIAVRLHEIRLMQNFLRNLNIFDGSDLYYFNIMNLQLKYDILSVKETSSNFISKLGSYINCYLIRFITYRLLFGRGVNFKNIFISTLILILFFGVLIFSTGGSIQYDKLSDICIENNCKISNLPLRVSFYISLGTFFSILVPSYIDDVVKFGGGLELLLVCEAIVGVIWITVLVSMIIRKFLRI